MKIKVKPEANVETFRIRKKTSYLQEKSFGVINTTNPKFYQKILVILVSISTVLILPESPKELEAVCHNYYSSYVCEAW